MLSQKVMGTGTSYVAPQLAAFIFIINLNFQGSFHSETIPPAQPGRKDPIKLDGFKTDIFNRHFLFIKA